MRWILNLTYCLVLLAGLPWFVWRSIRTGRYRRGWSAKLCGQVPRRTSPRPALWLHAVSVGEVEVASTIAEALRVRWPRHELIVTTSTDSGYELARRRFPNDLVSYAPWDFGWAVRRALRRLRPDALLLVELELWPNLIAMAHEKGVPACVLNGRLSRRSFVGYRRIRYLAYRMLRRVTLVAAQDEVYASRFAALGADAKRVRVTGSVKFDGAETDRKHPRIKQLREIAGIQEQDVVFVAGSTQAPEEAYAIQAFQQLSRTDPRLRLVLVPRHAERFGEVAELLQASRVPFVRWTEWQARKGQIGDVGPIARVMLVDTIGDLRYWWGLAQVAFVGGSMGSRGGQNMIEPAALGTPVCFGPQTRNFSDAVELLIASQAATVVHDRVELQAFVQRALKEPAEMAEMAQRAALTVAAQRGATRRTIDALADCCPQLDFQPPAPKWRTRQRPRAVERNGARRASNSKS